MSNKPGKDSMSFTINLESEDGNVIDSIDDKDILQRYLPDINDKRFYCIKFIDIYGDTTFNRLQADLFIYELKMIQHNNETEIKMLIEQLIDMATKCKNDVHLYVKFYGD
jgi:hypothetical protein